MTLLDRLSEGGWTWFRRFAGLGGFLVASVVVAAGIDYFTDIIPDESWNRFSELGPEAGEIVLKGAIATVFGGLVLSGISRVVGLHWPMGKSDSDH